CARGGVRVSRYASIMDAEYFDFW
nr:immunoglobulin heavy chain junction region [Macaca mulatta]